MTLFRPAAFLAVPLWLLATALPVRADDGMGTIVNGVITFSKSATIEMKSEVLRISLDKIEADFVFLNTAKVDETVTVAFPLPEIDMATSDGLNIPFGDRDNFVGFTTIVDGKPIEQGFEQRAFLEDGTEVTALLKAEGLPLFRDYWAYMELLKALPEDRQAMLIEKGVAEGEPGDLAAKFRVRSNFYFQTTFPAGKPISIRHTYKPSYDVTNTTVFASDEFPPEPDMMKTYCLTDATKAAIRAEEAKSENREFPYIPQFILDYVLATAKTWSGPIGSFHLIVDLNGENQILSTCLPLTRTAPTRFEMQRQAYVPDQDIHLMFFGGTFD